MSLSAAERRDLRRRVGATRRQRTKPERPPLYPRLLRLKHVSPNGWQRALFVEGTVGVGAIAALADRATWWAPVVLPAAMAVLVKFHDGLAGLLAAHDNGAVPKDDAVADRAGPT